MKTKRLVALLLVVLMVASFAGCGTASSSSSSAASSSAASSSAASSSAASSTASSTVDPEEAKYGGTLTWNGQNLPKNCYWPIGVQPSAQSLHFCIEPLMCLDLAEKPIMDRLVTELSRDNDKLQLTIKLREGVKFHDGSIMTAEVVAWNIQQHIDKGTATSLGSPVSAVATGEYTLVVTFKAFSLDWEKNIATVLIYSKDYYDEHGEDCYIDWVVGTGPFKLTDLKMEISAEFERFEDYWGKRAYLDKIKLVGIPDAMGMATAFVNKEIAYVCTMEESAVKIIEDAGNKTANGQWPSSASSPQGYYLIANDKPTLKNGEKNPFSIPEVRQAVMLYGLNYEEMIVGAHGDIGFWESHQWGTKDSYQYNKEAETGNTYDLAKAKQMLADAGYPNGFKTTIHSYGQTTNICTVLQAALKPLGIDAEIITVTDIANERKNGGVEGLLPTWMSATINDVNTLSGLEGRYGTIITDLKDHDSDIWKGINKVVNAKTREEQIKEYSDMWKWWTYEKCYFVNMGLYSMKNYIQPEFHGWIEQRNITRNNISETWWIEH